MRSASNFLCMVLLALAISPHGILGRNLGSQFVSPAARETNHDHFGLCLSLFCVPTTAIKIEEHEGRQKCAYDHPNGFRAVGVAYNLDDDVETRRSELSALFLDYHKVYRGDSCLWDIQVTALLSLDAKRALDKVTESVEPLKDFCCSVQAVFADIQHSIGASKSVPSGDLDGVVEKAALGEWTSAAHELEETDWCYDNKKRCEDNVETVKSGCNGLFGLKKLM